MRSALEKYELCCALIFCLHSTKNLFGCDIFKLFFRLCAVDLDFPKTGFRFLKAWFCDLAFIWNHVFWEIWIVIVITIAIPGFTFRSGSWRFTCLVVHGMHALNLLQLVRVSSVQCKNSFWIATKILRGLCFELWFGVLHKICRAYLYKAKKCLCKCICEMTDSHNDCSARYMRRC